MKKAILLLLPINIYAQADSIEAADTIQPQNLDEVVITPYEIQDELSIPSATGKVSAMELRRYSNSSILPAVNNIPGVKMEERSPGSYRFGIRGSAAGAPFGVRNIKMYYNGIPYTDAGGNTYLNQLGFYNIQSVEIIREPGSSLYGAGTGGVVLLNSMPDVWNRKVSLHFTAGSYGLLHMAAEVQTGTKNFQNTVRYQRLTNDGYRRHTQLHKDVYSWDGALRTGLRGKLNMHVLYGRLHYETPGGLTQAQYETDERQARPAAGQIPGAEDNKAAVNQEGLLAGVVYSYRLSAKWENTTTLYGRFTGMDNPTIRNYSKVYQPGFGGRNSIKYVLRRGDALLQYVLGAEVQQGYSYEETYQNLLGKTGTLQQKNDVNNLNTSVFTQVTAGYGRLLATAGASLNLLRVDVTSHLPVYNGAQGIFNNEIAPRLAMSFRVINNMAVYASAATGYSPPTTEELAPTGSTVNLALSPAHAWNYQAGARGSVWKNLHFDVVAFYTALQDMVVQRRDAAGGDYYVNAGSAAQQGVEATLKHSWANSNTGAFFMGINSFVSYTGYNFKYRQFVQGTADFSGNNIPGVAPAVLACGLHADMKKRVYADVNCYYSDIAPLNDANSISAGAYVLIDAKLGVHLPYRKHTAHVFAGVNNLLNQRYSLGNDINAVGGRFFNAAPAINFFTGVSFDIAY
jgi:iron complex outermembrane receptor protein